MPKTSPIEEAVQEAQDKPLMEYNNRTYQSYVKNGYADKIPHNRISQLPIRKSSSWVSGLLNLDIRIS